MNKIMIRGGYGEHGRSCFLVEVSSVEGAVSHSAEGNSEKKRLYMVDCGIMDTDPFPYPDVTPEELERVDYLFLTHCHKDHSGAFAHFCEHGFRGKLITAELTCKLAGIEYENTEFLKFDSSMDGASPMRKSESGKVPDVFTGIKNVRQFGPLTVEYGRTGHCPAGLWFKITDSSDTIVFSGDYQEDTLVYVCDPIRDSHAKLAFIDCAHRETEMSAGELRAQIVHVVTEKLQNGQHVILPVPQYGRGLELLYLMQKEFPEYRVRVDEDFVRYARKMLSDPIWYYDEAYRALKPDRFDVMDVEPAEQNCSADYDILLLADTHLKKQRNVDFVNRAIAQGAAVLINGRVKKNGPVGKLLDAGRAEKFLFPHHQSHGDLMRVAQNNSFHVILPFHNNEKEVLV